MSTNLIEGYSNGDLVEGLSFDSMFNSTVDYLEDKPDTTTNPPPPKPSPDSGVKTEVTITSPESSTETNTTQNNNYSLEELKNLENTLLSGSMTQHIATIFTTLNGDGLLYNKDGNKHVESIKKLGKITDLGKTENSQLLDFVENVVINFVNLSPTKLESSIKLLYSTNNYNNGRDILTDLYLSMAILNHNFFNESKGMEGANMENLTVIIDRLSKYIPDIFVQITSSLNDTDYAMKYGLMNKVFLKIFKTNETYVSFDIFSGLRPLFEYLKTFRTIEMVVIVLALAFIVSKVFDMFRVKVEV